MPFQISKSVYYLATREGDKVYDMNNNFIGLTSGYTAIAHNGVSEGKACLDTPTGCHWITGKGIFVEGMGIKLTEKYISTEDLLKIENVKE